MKTHKVIKNNESIVPFFGKRMNFTSGLDPMGLQNVSTSTYALLLPGLNNVTGRIRYYSFYCWLLGEYSKRNGSTDPEEQKKFIRTAEYIIALSGQFYEGSNGSIPGSNYAKEEMHKKGNTIHNLNNGIFKPDGTTAKTYWNYSWGAFGQYYLGSLRDIGIISERGDKEKNYVRTNKGGKDFISGEELALSFDKNIPPDKKELYFNCIEKGEISNEQLQELLPDFNLTKIPKGSEEQQLLTKLLIQKDKPLKLEEAVVQYRKDTIFHLLKFAESAPKEFSDRQFVYMAYDKKILEDATIQTSLTGWYYYQFNEFWQYANTAILNGILAFLETKYGPNWVSLDKLVSEVSTLVIEKFESEKFLTEKEESLSIILQRLKPDEYKYHKNVGESNKIDRLFYGFLLMFSLYLNNLKQLLILRQLSNSNNLVKDGEGATYFTNEFTAKQEQPLSSFIKDGIS